MRKLLPLLVFFAACGVIRPPRPPQPPSCPESCPLGSECKDPAKGCEAIPAPGAECAAGQGCGCWHWPPDSRTWLYACCVPSVPGGVVNVVGGPAQCPAPPAPTCPEACPAGQSCSDPAVGCVPTTTPPPTSGCNPTLAPSMLPPLDNDTDWKPVAGATATRTSEVNSAILAAQAACQSAWRGTGTSACLVAGVPGIDNGFAQIAAQLHARGIKAGQPYVEGEPGKRIDALSVATSSANQWEEWHLFYYGNGCLISGSPYKGTWLYTGSGGGTPPPVEPPPSTGACSNPIPPKVGKWGGPKPHNRTNDSTPLFYGRETTRWDGSTSNGFCEALGMGDKLWCPARNECPGVKCEERVPCEEIGVSGVYGGKPLWRSDGTVHLSDNPYQSTCSGCTWLEVCAADGTNCSRCQIDAATGLCAGAH